MHRHTKAQLSIDFLVGIIIFTGALLFVFQFLSATIIPFAQNVDEKKVTVDKVSDTLYYEKLATEKKGVLDLGYLYNGTANETKGGEELLKELNVDTDKHSINITVVDEEGVNELDDKVARINESGFVDTGSSGDGVPARIGSQTPTGSVNKATRVGYAGRTGGNQDPKTVVVKIRMW